MPNVSKVRSRNPLKWIASITCVCVVLSSVIVLQNFVRANPIFVTPNQPRDAGNRAVGPYQHVILIDIDGFRQADLADPLLAPDMPNILALQKNGVTYTNASTAPLSDSYPGLMNLVTGASPKTTGIYYDVEYSRTLYPPGSVTTNGNVFLNGVNITSTPGAQVNFAENIDINSDLGSGGGSPGFGISSVDTTHLPLQLTGTGAAAVLKPVFPHSYLKCATIFEVAHLAGLRTAYCDKHAGAYEIVNGPSGVGCDDFYGVESDSFQTAVLASDGFSYTVTDAAKKPGPGLKAKSNLFVSLGQDDLKFAAVINQINGKDSRGKPAPVPALFGTEVLSLSTAEKMITDSNGLKGGIDGTANAEVVNNGMHMALSHIDTQIGKVVAALKATNQYSSTLIVISAKHGQTPRVGQPTIVDQTNSTIDPFADALVNAGINVGNDDQDTICNIWLSNQAQTAQALTVLNGLKSNTALQINTIFSKGSFPAGFGDPTTDDRTPDISVSLKPGCYIDNVPSGKRSEHGGVSADETNVVLLIGGTVPAAVAGTKQTAAISTRSAAVTMLTALGLDTTKLTGAVAESTPALPGAIDGPIVLAAGTATPAAASIGQSVNFTVSATALKPLTITWNFGDGSAVGTGATVRHAYATAGAYMATLTVTDGINTPYTQTLAITVKAPSAGVGPDSDGDGFSDALEITAGSNPHDSTSTPFGGAPAPSPDSTDLKVKSVSVKLNFKKTTQNDSITLVGEIPVPSGLSLAQKVVLDVNDVATAFTLDAKGQSGKGLNTFKLTVAKGKTTGKFTAKLGKGTFAQILATVLPNTDSKKKSTTLFITVLFNKNIYTHTSTVDYTAKKGTSGTATGKN